MPRTSTVIFDLDGTLVDSETVMGEAFSRASIEHGISDFETVYKEFRLLSGRPLAEIVVALGLPAGFGDTFRRFSQRYAHKTRMFDGIEALLSELHSRRVPMAVLTGKERDRTEYILHLLGIRQFFPLLVTGTDPVPPKPDRRSVDHILQTLGVVPEEACYVGDGLVDLQVATSAGVPVVMCLWGVSTEAQLVAAGGKCIVGTVAQLHRELTARCGAPCAP